MADFAVWVALNIFPVFPGIVGLAWLGYSWHRARMRDGEEFTEGDQ